MLSPNEIIYTNNLNVNNNCKINDAVKAKLKNIWSNPK